jgi:hypothetical protein
MAAVLHVTAHVGQVHEQCRHPIPSRFLHIADLGGDDRLVSNNGHRVEAGDRSAGLAEPRMEKPTMRNPRLNAVLLGAMALAACSTTAFHSTWKAPDARPVSATGEKVIALVVNANEASRREAEDVLARELTKRGAAGIPAYTVLGDVDLKNEGRIKEAFEKAGAVGVVVLRPVGKEKEVYSTPSVYTGPYGTFWGGYYPGAWSGGQVRTDTIVIVETLVYSLRQNKLVWAGESRTTNPTNVDAFVQELAAEAAAAMKKQGVIAD